MLSLSWFVKLMLTCFCCLCLLFKLFFISLYRVEQLQQPPNLPFTLTATPQRAHTEQINSFFHDVREMNEKIFRIRRELTSHYFPTKVVRLREKRLVFQLFPANKTKKFIFFPSVPPLGMSCSPHAWQEVFSCLTAVAEASTSQHLRASIWGLLVHIIISSGKLHLTPEDFLRPMLFHLYHFHRFTGKNNPSSFFVQIMKVDFCWVLVSNAGLNLLFESLWTKGKRLGC